MDTNSKSLSAHMDKLSTQITSGQVRQWYDKTEIHIRGLQALGIEAEQYGSLLVPVLQK